MYRLRTCFVWLKWVAGSDEEKGDGGRNDIQGFGSRVAGSRSRRGNLVNVRPRTMDNLG